MRSVSRLPFFDVEAFVAKVHFFVLHDDSRPAKGSSIPQRGLMITFVLVFEFARGLGSRHQVNHRRPTPAANQPDGANRRSLF